MKRILIELLLLIAIGGLLWVAVAFFIKLPESPTLISVENEQEIGQKYANFIHKIEGFYKIEDQYFNEIFDSTADKLYRAQKNAAYEYKISIIDNETVNAFALPGGYLIITKGLINFCETPEELIAVICHEVGHIEKRHVVSRLIKDLGLEVISLGDDYVVGEISKSILSSGYNRQQEEEADIFSCELMLKLNLEPRVMATLFRRLKEKNEEGMFSQFEMVASHPNFTSRIKSILAFKIPKGFTPQKSWIDLEKLKQAVEEQ